MIQISETEAFRACRVLFGNDLKLNREFLNYLQPSGARNAFRKRAKSTHPDSCRAAPPFHKNQVRKFQDLNQAYQLIKSYLHQRDLLTSRRHQGPSCRPARPAGPVPKEPFYNTTSRGPLPTRPLQFGLYLYYRGLISFTSLISALTWQRQQRPAFGQIAQRWGWLNLQEIGLIRGSRCLGRFGERAEHLGLLSSIQVRAILLHQRSRQNKLGAYFIEQKLLTASEVEQQLRDLSAHNLKYRHGYPHHFYFHQQD